MSEPADAPPDQNAFEAGRYDVKAEVLKAIYKLRETNPSESEEYVMGWLDATAAILLELDSL